MAVNVGEAEVAPLIAVGELTMVNAEQVKDCGIKVVNMNTSRSPVILGRLREDGRAVGLDDVIAVVVGAAIGDAGLDSATGHPGCEATGVMVPPVILFGELTLAVGGAAKFTAPDDESILEHVPLFEVGDQGGAGLVDILAL